MAFDHRDRPAGQGTVQRGAQAERTGPDHHDVGVHQAIVPDRRVTTGGDMARSAGLVVLGQSLAFADWLAIAAIVTANVISVSNSR
jgi:hypothetical protein